MSGVIMSVKGRYAVMLSKNGGFIKIKNRNYSVGEIVTVTAERGARMYAAAACIVLLCAGIGSYFTPVNYMSVDINPSFLMSVNIYGRVISVKPLNRDAETLLENTSVRGKKTLDTLETLIRTSEELGYVNSGVCRVRVDTTSARDAEAISGVSFGNVKVIVEMADKDDVRRVKGYDVSMAKVNTNEGNSKDTDGADAGDAADKDASGGVKPVSGDIPRSTPHAGDVYTGASKADTFPRQVRDMSENTAAAADIRYTETNKYVVPEKTEAKPSEPDADQAGASIVRTAPVTEEVLTRETPPDGTVQAEPDRDTHTAPRRWELPEGCGQSTKLSEDEAAATEETTDDTKAKPEIVQDIKDVSESVPDGADNTAQDGNIPCDDGMPDNSGADTEYLKPEDNSTPPENGIKENDSGEDGETARNSDGEPNASSDGGHGDIPEQVHTPPPDSTPFTDAAGDNGGRGEERGQSHEEHEEHEERMENIP